VEEQVFVIFAGTRGYLDSIPTAQVGEYEQKLLEHMRASGKEILETIRDEKALSDTTIEKMKSFLESFTKGFAGNLKKAA
jgi:F-type H+/Na+-transporting ATPase subunit alpha